MYGTLPVFIYFLLFIHTFIYLLWGASKIKFCEWGLIANLSVFMISIKLGKLIHEGTLRQILHIWIKIFPISFKDEL